MKTCLSILYYFQQLFLLFVCRAVLPQMQLEEYIFGDVYIWSEGDYIDAFEVKPSCEFCTALLCARAWMHVIFSFSSLQMLCSVFQGALHGGSHFLCFIWNRLMVHPVLISSPLYCILLSCWWDSCTLFWYSFSFKVVFSSCDSCVPWQNRIRSKWGMFSAAKQWLNCVAISANQYPFPCK